jgi:hypothetical protein
MFAKHSIHAFGRRVWTLAFAGGVTVAAAVFVALQGCSSSSLVPEAVPRPRCDADSLPRINAPRFAGEIPLWANGDCMVRQGISLAKLR